MALHQAASQHHAELPPQHRLHSGYPRVPNATWEGSHVHSLTAIPLSPGACWHPNRVTPDPKLSSGVDTLQFLKSRVNGQVY